MGDSSQHHEPMSSDGESPAQTERFDSPTDAFDPGSLIAQLVHVLDRYLTDLKAGTAPSRETLLAAHPQLADQLEACLAGVEFIYSAEMAGSSAPTRLGDFLIGREIGRGGMGTVFEAEQLSLERKVALKVLRFGAIADPEAVDRFKREAATVANLHHTNIVPVFSVGSEGGVTYYAMQLIEGRGLDRVAAEQDNHLQTSTVARWGLQAAEALAHAHRRGVIHRDVKPSNLLLDEEGRIWLTDFGLAKRLDDVTLSITGALLGTPRYMSPEQAEAAIKTVDHRTDIYSLGATLYELATGQPVFAGDTPHGVINQILNNEPEPPRKLRPDLPRDVETILMKCLSKEASRRYATAGELAEDLRAAIEQRPIRARRPPVAERAARWVREQKRSVLLSATAVAATLFLVALVIGGRMAYLKWQLATLNLSTKTPGLVAGIISEDGRARMEVLPTQQPIELWSGEIQLHVSGHNQLSQSFGASLSPGQQRAFDVRLDDQKIGREVAVERSFRLMHFSDGVDPLLLSEQAIQRWDPERDFAIWTLDMTQQSGSLVPGAPKIRWPWQNFISSASSGSQFDQRPYVLGQLDPDDMLDAHRGRDRAIDLDRDGELDIVLASREQAWLLAVSGRTGNVLWLAVRGSDLQGQPAGTNPSDGGQSANLAPPLVANDLDGDDVPDLIASFADVGSIDLRDTGPNLVPTSRWLEAISGRTGETIWRSDFEASLFSLPGEMKEIPPSLRWFVGLTEASTLTGRGGIERSGGIALRRRDRVAARTGPHGWRIDAPRIVAHGPIPRNGAEGDRSADASSNLHRNTHSVVCVAGTHVVLLDLRTGQRRGEPQDTGRLSALPARYADMDGDGVLDVVLCDERPRKMAASDYGTGGQVAQFRIAVWSLTESRLMWERTVDALWPRSPEAEVPAPAWPLLVDLDGDDACEVLLPIGTTNVGVQFSRPKGPWGEFAILEGATGAIRWQRRLFTLDQQIDHFIAGPDLDNDGSREVFVASLWGTEFDLFVDALSGADGHTLWSTRHTLNRSSSAMDEYWVGRVSWWDAGNDGWPQLGISLHPKQHSQNTGGIWLVSAGTGQLQQVALGAVVAWPANVNRDGCQDLCAFVPSDPSAGRSSELSFYHGVAAEYWRRLGEHAIPVGDLDGDGIRDRLTQPGPNRLAALSSLSRKRLWTTQVGIAELRRFEILSERGDHVAGWRPTHATKQRDFDQDGTADLLLGLHSQRTPSYCPMHAISGRTGERLWQADFQVRVCRRSPLVQFQDLDGDQSTEIIYVGAMDLDFETRHVLSSDEHQLWLIVLSSKDGKVRWKRSLTPASGQSADDMSYSNGVDMLRLESPMADLNGDGVLDLVLPAAMKASQRAVDDASLALIAVDGSDGELLWRHALPSWPPRHSPLAKIPPALAVDLDADGQPEIVTLELEHVNEQQPRRVAHLRALEGGTGQVRWQWKSNVSSNYGDLNDPRQLEHRPRPIALQTASGHSRVAVVLSHNNSLASFVEAAVLDWRGQTLSRIPLIRNAGNSSGNHRCLPCDVDGDGNEELLFWNRRSLVALRPDAPAQPLWTHSLKTRFGAELVGLQEQPGIAVVRQGDGDNSLIGVDTTTGAVRWACAGPSARDGSGWKVLDRVELLGSVGEQAPLILFEFSGVTVCRQASLMSHEADVTLPSVPAVMRTPVVLKPNAADPRRLRDLPWRVRWDDRTVGRFKRWGKWSSFYCMTLILVPGAILTTLARRRKCDWTATLAAAGGFVVLLIGMTVGDIDAESPLRVGRWLMALAGLPAIQFFGELACQASRHQWRRALTWLTVVVVVTASLAWIVLRFHASRAELMLQPLERYSTDGWYLIGLWGAYVTGILMLALAFVRLVVRVARRRSAKQVVELTG